MQNPRTRLVSVRMTEEEYDRLRDTALVGGARSVSDYARTALLTTREPLLTTAPNWCQTLAALTERIAKVEDEVAEVKKTLP